MIAFDESKRVQTPLPNRINAIYPTSFAQSRLSFGITSDTRPDCTTFVWTHKKGQEPSGKSLPRPERTTRFIVNGIVFLSVLYRRYSERDHSRYIDIAVNGGAGVGKGASSSLLKWLPPFTIRLRRPFVKYTILHDKKFVWPIKFTRNGNYR
jgi:hypothetical protein